MSNEERKAKIIAVTLQKGGVGKTVVSVNLASILAWKGYNVLLVDGDRHCSASQHLGIHDETKVGFYDVITGKCSFDEAIQLIPYQKLQGNKEPYVPFDLYAIPSYDNLGKSEEMLKDISGWQFLLKQTIEKSEAINYFDYIIIDCPPESDIFLSIIYNAAEYYIFPLFAEFTVVANLSISYEQLYTLSDPQSTKKILGCIVTNFARTNTSKGILKELQSLDYIHCFTSVLPRYEEYGLLPLIHFPINVFYKETYKGHKLFSAFRDFADEVIEATKSR